MNFWYIFLAVLCVLALVGKAIYDSVADRKKTERELRDAWGRRPGKEHNAVKYESIQKYYESIRKDDDIDDITWNDLDMDDVYALMDTTLSSVGEEMLYACLRKPLFQADEIYYRNKIIEHFMQNEEDRMAVQSRLKIMGSHRNISFYEFFQSLKNVKRESNLYHYIIILAWLAGVALIFFNTAAAITVLVADIAVAIITYYRRKAQIEVYYSVLNYVLRMMYCAKKFSDVEIPAIKRELHIIKEVHGRMSSFRRMSGIVLNPNGGSILDIILDYARMLTHIDLIKFNNMLDTIIKRNDEILTLHNTLGFLDAMIAAGSYRQMCMTNGWCVPDFTDGETSIVVKDIYHPMISEPVYNSIDAKGGILLTGSNASGKSTLLKAIAINAILAQTIATVNASRYRAICFRIMTSMALKDSLVNNQSYFIVEIMSLRRILDVSPKIRVLCCIDEVLRGTNTIERIAASSHILKKLCDNGALCFAATHDTELAKILGRHYSNYHFREKIEGDKIIFDYTLYKGCATTKNAIKLLGLLEYEKEIVDSAEELAHEFEETGTWPQI